MFVYGSSFKGIICWAIVYVLGLRCAILGEEVSSEWPFFLFSSAGEDRWYGYFKETRGYSHATSASDILRSNAYVTNRKTPLGCDCQKTGDTESECSFFECTCICDLTAGTFGRFNDRYNSVLVGACDYNCCCDTECNDAQTSRFDMREMCLPEGPIDQKITKYNA